MNPVLGWSAVLSDWDDWRRERLALSHSSGSHGALSLRAGPLSWFQTPSLLPTVLIAWPTYDCDAVILPHNSPRCTRICHSVTETFPPSASPLQRKRASRLSPCRVYKRTEAAVTNRPWSRCRCRVYVLLPLPPACTGVEAASGSCLVCLMTIVAS